MSTVFYVYIFCLALGFIWAVISGLMAGFFGSDIDGGGADVDVGAADLDFGDVDIGDLDIDGGPDTGAVHFSPLSPVTISMFLVSFGAAGAISDYFYGLKIWASLPVSILAGFLVGAATFFLFYKIYSMTQASSEAKQADLPGTEAEVVTRIPAEGMGKVAYILKGTRYTASARSETGEIGQGEVVKIGKVIGSTLYVAPSDAGEKSGAE